MFNALSFNDMNSDIVFSKSSESIKLLENPNRMFFSMHDNKKNFDFELEVTVEYDKEKNDSNIVIKSID